MQGHIIKYLSLSQHGEGDTFKPSNLALVSRLWTQEIQSIYYDCCIIADYDRSIIFFKAILNPIEGVKTPGRWIRRLQVDFIPPDDEDGWWEMLEAVVGEMTRLEQFAVTFTHFDPTIFGRYSLMAHLFPNSLHTLRLISYEDEYSEVSGPFLTLIYC